MRMKPHRYVRCSIFTTTYWNRISDIHSPHQLAHQEASAAMSSCPHCQDRRLPSPAMLLNRCLPLAGRRAGLGHTSFVCVGCPETWPCSHALKGSLGRSFFLIPLNPEPMHHARPLPVDSLPGFSLTKRSCSTFGVWTGISTGVLASRLASLHRLLRTPESLSPGVISFGRQCSIPCLLMCCISRLLLRLATFVIATRITEE